MTTVQLVRVEDHDGDGHCGHCGREGLRWIAVLSDGQRVGTACARKMFGWKIDTKDFAWTAEFTPIAEHTEFGDVWVLWQHEAHNSTRETRNGHLQTVGGARDEWQRRNWI